MNLILNNVEVTPIEHIINGNNVQTVFTLTADEIKEEQLYILRVLNSPTGFCISLEANRHLGPLFDLFVNAFIELTRQVNENANFYLF